MPIRVKSAGMFFLILGAILAMGNSWCPAEVRVVWDRNANGAATTAFDFKDVPRPSKTDLGTVARFSAIAGRADGNGGDVDVLNDGGVPADADQPGANFFFAQRSRGGRLLVDLGEATALNAINIYSWHRGTRAPQVYVVYGSDGAAAGFQLKPAQDGDLEKAGWRRIAAVDTRPKEGEPGGQYGVSIAESGGGPLGKYRYLLLDISRTEDADPFGNTFFSEIDVVDGRTHVAPDTAGKYEITIDASDMPELKDWVDAKLQPACEKWYPKIVEMLASEGYRPPRRFTVTFHKDMDGVAHTSGTSVHCAGRWFRQNRDGEGVGAVIHELVHVVQQYGRARGGSPNPGWLVEGVADYIRWFHFEPASLRPRPDPARAKYTDSYRTTAAFLDYVVRTDDKDLIKTLNTAMRTGKYSPELWKTATGKTVDALWAEYVKTLRKP